MFKTTHDLREFILWCRQAKIKAVKVGNVEVQFSDLAFLNEEDLTELSEVSLKQLKADASMQEAVDAKEAEDEDNDLLFWSVGENSIMPPQE